MLKPFHHFKTLFHRDSRYIGTRVLFTTGPTAAMNLFPRRGAHVLSQRLPAIHTGPLVHEHDRWNTQSTCQMRRSRFIAYKPPRLRKKSISFTNTESAGEVHDSALNPF